ncbi:MAG: DUF1656 domain-containing protein [Pseudomonadota bacterium]
MNAEISLYGLYIPSILPLCLLALICTRACGRLLMRLGFYRLVWHPALFEFALFFILLAGLSRLFTHHGYQ